MSLSSALKPNWKNKTKEPCQVKKILFLLIVLAAFIVAWPASAAQTQNSTAQASQVSDEFGDDDMDFLDEEEGEAEDARISDPFEPINRVWFTVNDTLYFYALKPAAQGYKAVTPGFLRRGIKNFFKNLETPIRLVNCLFQGKPKKAGTEFLRFMVNTTVGFGGLGDPSTKYHEMEIAKEDMGQTLAVWGLGSGPYLVWPVLGPYSLRHTGGFIFDRVLYAPTYIDHWETSLMVKAGQTINDTTFRIGDYEALIEAAVDPYDAVRNAYVQYRNKKIKE